MFAGLMKYFIVFVNVFFNMLQGSTWIMCNDKYRVRAQVASFIVGVVGFVNVCCCLLRFGFYFLISFLVPFFTCTIRYEKWKKKKGKKHGTRTDNSSRRKR